MTDRSYSRICGLISLDKKTLNPLSSRYDRILCSCEGFRNENKRDTAIVSIDFCFKATEFSSRDEISNGLVIFPSLSTLSSTSKITSLLNEIG